MIARTDANSPANVPLRFHLAERGRVSSEAGLAQDSIFTSVGDWIGRHPVICISAAVTLGVALGCLIKRR